MYSRLGEKALDKNPNVMHAGCQDAEFLYILLEVVCTETVFRSWQGKAVLALRSAGQAALGGTLYKAQS